MAGHLLSPMLLPGPILINNVCNRMVMLHFLCQLHALKMSLPISVNSVSFHRVTSQFMRNNLLKYGIDLLIYFESWLIFSAQNITYSFRTSLVQGVFGFGQGLATYSAPCQCQDQGRLKCSSSQALICNTEDQISNKLLKFSIMIMHANELVVFSGLLS